MKYESIAIDVRECAVITKRKVAKKLFNLGVSKDNYGKDHSITPFPDGLISDVGWFYITDRFRPEGQWGIEWNNSGYDHKEKDGIRYTVDELLSGKVDNMITSRIDISHKKVVNCKIDLDWCKGLAREVISEAIQKKLFEAGARWNNGSVTPTDKDASYLFVAESIISFSNDKRKFDGLTGGSVVSLATIKSLNEVSVNNALKGNFWTYSTKKEEPKPEGYKVSLAAYTGKAREAVSKAIQEEAFKKGYGWGRVFTEPTIQNTESMFVYFDVSTKSILQDSTADAGYFDSHKYKELSVEEILSGALPKVN